MSIIKIIIVLKNRKIVGETYETIWDNISVYQKSSESLPEIQDNPINTNSNRCVLSNELICMFYWITCLFI